VALRLCESAVPLTCPVRGPRRTGPACRPVPVSLLAVWLVVLSAQAVFAFGNGLLGSTSARVVADLAHASTTTCSAALELAQERGAARSSLWSMTAGGSIVS
jgi:hypothetical protein